MAALNTRRLNRRVIVERATTTDDEIGGQIVTWSPIGVDYVEAIPSGGSEGLENGALRSSQRYTVAMRWRAIDEATCRFRADWLPGRVLTIQSAVDPDGRRRELRLDCEAIPG